MKVINSPPRNSTELFSGISAGMTREDVVRALNKNMAKTHVQRQLDKLHTQDPVMLKCKEWIKRVAYLDEPVLITGPTGTGKELLASACVSRHHSDVKACPFVAINCGSINRNLIETQFFGAVKGAYTGAATSSIGLLQQAEDGIVFLDEIGDLPLENQAALLRAIQENKIYQVGSTNEIKISCRFVAATKYNLEEQVDKGLFRDDLFARISILSIKTTSLKERPADIPYIAEKWLQWTNPIPEHALPRIYRYNVRGLQAVVTNLRLFGEFIP